MKAILALEDGSVFHGEGFGAQASACGEVCFNTSMTGYQEALTDPSYRGQILTMTYPLQGNYGTSDGVDESNELQVRGFVVREMTDLPSHWRSSATLHQYLARNGVAGIAEVTVDALGAPRLGLLPVGPPNRKSPPLRGLRVITWLGANSTRRSVYRGEGWGPRRRVCEDRHLRLLCCES